MLATYRTLGSPVSRTIDLPDDPKRARSVAVLLAGNVARQEADELLGAKPAPAPAPSAPPTPNADAELGRFRSMLGNFTVDERRARIGGGATFLGLGALQLGLGGYYVAKGGSYREEAGAMFMVSGGIDAVFGIVELALPSPYERMQRDLDTDVKNGVVPEKALANAEERWGRLANNMESARKRSAALNLALGSVCLGLGLVRPALLSESTRQTEDPSVAWSAVAIGSVAIVNGVYRLLVPSNVEQTWTTYQRMKAPPARSTIQTSFAASPLRGGGTVGFAMTF